MKKVLVAFLLTLSHTITYGQFKQLAEGSEFSEPNGGRGQLLQLKNGNTAFIQYFTEDNDLKIEIYGPDHQLKSKKKIIPPYKNLDEPSIHAIFENNDKIEMFVSGYTENSCPLNKMIFNTNTGNLEKTVKIEEFTNIKYKKNRKYLEYHQNAYFLFRKDVSSNSYAVVKIPAADDEKKTFEVILFNGDSKEIARASYQPVNEHLDQCEVEDLVTIEGEKVELIVHERMHIKRTYFQSFVIAELTKGSSSITTKELSLNNVTKDNDYDTNIGKLNYHPVTKKLMFIVAMRESYSHSYFMFSTNLIVLDPATKKVEKDEPVTLTKIDQKNIELFGRKHPYRGIPQQLFINRDGTYTIVFQEVFDWESGGKTRYSNNGPRNIGVATYDMNGKEKTMSLIPVDYFFYSARKPVFYQARYQQPLNGVLFGDSDDFKAFSYLNGKDKNYILLNDTERNTEKAQKGDDLVTVKGVLNCDNFVYDVSGTNILPERKFVFENLATQEKNNLNLCNMASYNPENNEYVTLKFEVRGSKKNFKLVWMQL